MINTTMESEIKKTKDYSIFKEISSNREIDQKHVNRLVKSIREKNLLSINPIVVNEGLYVIDGQHRLEAAKILGVEIYYIIGNADRKDISVINSFQKNWKAMDYINFYTIEKVGSFVQISHLINQYPKMAISALLSLSNSEGRRNITDLKNGFLDVLEISHAKEISELCYELSEKFGYDFVFDSRFPIALSSALKEENFKKETLINKISDAPRSFVPCHTVKEYLEMIEEVYNRNLSKNKIKIAA